MTTDRPPTPAVASDARDRYVFDTADDDERARLDAHGALWDDFTFRRLETTGIDRGWHCLEIGAGTGSVAAWMADRVGPDGHVVATDIETRWLEPATATNVEVRHHNVSVDPLEPAGYDLIHCRLVLEHLPQRRVVVAKLVNALRRGGWMVVEDYDVRTMAMVAPERPAWAAANDAVIGALRASGVDPLTGADLVRLMLDADLRDVTAEGCVWSMRIPDLAPVFEAPFRRLAPLMLRNGLLTGEQVVSTLYQFGADDDCDRTTAYTPILVSAAGRRA